MAEQKILERKKIWRFGGPMNIYFCTICNDNSNRQSNQAKTHLQTKHKMSKEEIDNLFKELDDK